MERKYTKDYNFKKKEIKSKRQNARIDRFQNDKTDFMPIQMKSNRSRCRSLIKN